jgi:hypothetical protein
MLTPYFFRHAVRPLRLAELFAWDTAVALDAELPPQAANATATRTTALIVARRRRTAPW